MTNKLIEICDAKREEVARRKAVTSLATLQERAVAQTPSSSAIYCCHTSNRRTQRNTCSIISSMARCAPKHWPASKGITVQ